MPTRKNILKVTRQERDEFIRALSVLKLGGTYDKFLRLHRDIITRIHNTPQFFPWHRMFLIAFEDACRGAVGNPDFCLPYWDWAAAAELARPAASKLWTRDYLGGSGNPVGDGPFKDWAMDYTPSFGARPRLIRGLGNWASYASLPDQWAVEQAVLLRRAFGDFRRFAESTHNDVHHWIGGLSSSGLYGHMTTVADSVNDPAFWLHYANTDRIWSAWQRRWPNARIEDGPSFDERTVLPWTDPRGPDAHLPVAAAIVTDYDYEEPAVSNQVFFKLRSPVKANNRPLCLAITAAASPDPDRESRICVKMEEGSDDGQLWFFMPLPSRIGTHAVINKKYMKATYWKNGGLTAVPLARVVGWDEGFYFKISDGSFVSIVGDDTLTINGDVRDWVDGQPASFWKWHGQRNQQWSTVLVG